MKKLLYILPLFLLMSCDRLNDRPVIGSVDRAGKPITTTVYFYDTVEEVQAKFREVHNLPHNYKTNVQGFARWPEYRDHYGKPVADGNNPLDCEIHTVRPRKIDDEATLTLGHEMLHCVIGTYHPEGEG